MGIPSMANSTNERKNEIHVAQSFVVGSLTV